MNPADLEGKTYGPQPWRVGNDPVADFISLTGDDPNRWSSTAPPGFAASALFAVAPDLLAELSDRSVVHGEQTFEWRQPLSVGGLFDVTGRVTKVRERGGIHFVTFEMEARDNPEVVVSGKSLFLVAGEAVPGGEPGLERPEPHHSYDGDPAHGQVSASRSDLVRYASATRDLNPVHWDHDAGVAAGFPGVVVHGLLQAGWALRVAAAATDSPRPFTSAKFRFRNPLLPARPVSYEIVQGEGSIAVTLADEDTEYLSASVAITHG
jgi:acyl dehydratase